MLKVTEKQLEIYFFVTTRHDRSQWSNYKSRFRKIQSYFQDKDFTKETISEFILSLSVFSTSTQNMYYDMLLYLCRILNLPYMNEVKRVHVVNRRKHILYPEEMKRVLKVAYQRNDRYALVIELTLRQGLRYNEVRNLKHSDLVGNELTLRDTKSGTPQIVYLPQDLVDKIHKHKNGKEYIFEANNGLFANHGINLFIKKILRDVGIDKPITFHDLRHSTASDLINHDVNMYVVKEYMRHKQLATTEKYCHLYPYKLVEVAKRHSLSGETWTKEDLLKEVARFQTLLLDTPYKLNIEYKEKVIVLRIRTS